MQYQHGILAEIEMEIRHGSIIFKMSKLRALQSLKTLSNPWILILKILKIFSYNETFS